MKLGPSTLLTCPICGGPKYIQSVLSGNSFNGTIWSDTKRDYPMLPTISAVQRCRHCGGYFFYEDAEPKNYLQVEEDEKMEWLFPGSNGILEKVLSDKAISEKQIEKWIEKRWNIIDNEAEENGFGALTFSEINAAWDSPFLYLTADDKRKRELLFQWLYAYNDTFGGRQEGIAPEIEPRIQNRRQYIVNEICRICGEDRLLVAELHRELGDFDGCIRIASEFIEGDQYQIQVIRGKLIHMARKGSTDVFKMLFVRPGNKNVFELMDD